MRALLFERSPARYAAARVAGAWAPGGGARVGPLRLAESAEEPDLPGPDWTRLSPLLSGICGSDLSTIDGRSSRYFEPIVSFPFVPGHEVVGRLVGGPEDGARVVLEPVLGCAARGIEPPCAGCASGHTGGCERVAFGHVKPGLQTGFCADTGGGWSTGLVAHTSQLHAVPDNMSDEDAVMVEPTACGIHAAMSAGDVEGATVAVLGAGTLGLTVIAALRHLCLPGVVIAAAKHPHQRRLAADLGADHVVEADELGRAVRRHTRALAVGEGLSGGADVVLDCVGSSESLAESLAVVRPRGRVVMVGMPGVTRVDLTGLWHREIQLAGAYAYGCESPAGRGAPVRTFDLALDLVQEAGLGRLVSARYPLERYADAIAHAASAGRRGAVKIVFDLQHESRRPTWRTE